MRRLFPTIALIAALAACACPFCDRSDPSLPIPPLDRTLAISTPERGLPLADLLVIFTDITGQEFRVEGDDERRVRLWTDLVTLREVLDQLAEENGLSWRREQSLVLIESP
ncbi:hypothetical protein JXA47_01660 [Candidatus Sumerlaeota bacterium]|nr:hypothetical protein [Candidatus Sumerlaeota bacterium]